ncbi:DUF6124 family protein [Pseudomonas caspiana]
MLNTLTEIPDAPEPVLKPSAVKRALSFYLPVCRPQREEAGGFTDIEATLNHASEFLRCAAATASELGEMLSGSNRDLALTAMHMVEMAKVMVERSLECVEVA